MKSEKINEGWPKKFAYLLKSQGVFDFLFKYIFRNFEALQKKASFSKSNYS
jgi:hypothetical protein